MNRSRHNRSRSVYGNESRWTPKKWAAVGAAAATLLGGAAVAERGRLIGHTPLYKELGAQVNDAMSNHSDTLPNARKFTIDTFYRSPELELAYQEMDGITEGSAETKPLTQLWEVAPKPEAQAQLAAATVMLSGLAHGKEWNKARDSYLAGLYGDTENPEVAYLNALDDLKTILNNAGPDTEINVPTGVEPETNNQ